MMPLILKTAALTAIALAALACNGDNSRTMTRLAAESPAGGEWRTLAPMPTPRSETALVADEGGQIWVIGGLEGDGSPSAKVEIYDTKTDSWSTAEPLPAPLYDAAAVLTHGTPMITGGFKGTSDDPSNTVFSPNYPSGWFEWDPMPSARGGHTAVVVPCGRVDVGFDCVYAVGGLGKNREVLSRVDMFDFYCQCWEDVADPPLPARPSRRYHAGLQGLRDRRSLEHQ